jgi:hypothetical protein
MSQSVPDTGNTAPIKRRGYQADEMTIRGVQALAFILSIAPLVVAGPGIRALFSEAMPNWAWLVIAIGAVQGAYLVWMVLLPDFASIWLVAWVYAAIAALHALAIAILTFASKNAALPLGLSNQTATAALWCALVIVLCVIGCYLAGRVAVRWRRVWYEWEVGQ